MVLTLPPSATKYPTKVLTTDNFTSNQEGAMRPSILTVKSQRPIMSLSAKGATAAVFAEAANRPQTNPREKKIFFIQASFINFYLTQQQRENFALLLQMSVFNFIHYTGIQQGSGIT